MWSFVGAFVGKRSEERDKGLWDSLPPAYQQCAVTFSDFWDAYPRIFPSKRHQPSALPLKS